MLFSIEKNDNVKKISSIEAKSEKYIQNVFEKNLNEILNIIFLATEYRTTDGRRIDTLGIEGDGTPVIIEYKKKQSSSVINQAISYLRWLKDHKADFKALVQKAKVDIEIDWSAPKIICVAKSYNKFDRDTADEVSHIKIELLEFVIYKNNILWLDRKFQQENSSAKKVSDKEKKEKPAKEYTIKYHLSDKPQKIQEMFGEINKRIIELDSSIKVEPKKSYIAYKLVTNFVNISLQKSAVLMVLNVPNGALDDPHKITKYSKRHFGTGDYEVKLGTEEHMDAVFELIEQSYNHHK